MTLTSRSLAICALALSVGCHSKSSSPAPNPTIRVQNVVALADTANALAATVSFDAVEIATVQVAYSAASDPEQLTPMQAVSDGGNRVRVLGLRPSTTYDLELRFVATDGERSIETVQLTSGDLPAFLRDRVELVTTGTPSPGYVVTSTISSDPTQDFVFAFDEAGEVRWYAEVPEIGTYTGQQPNGSHVVFIGTTTGWQPTYGYFLELNPFGDVIGRYQAPAPLYTDNHELLLTDGPGGRYWHLFSYDLRRTDLTRFGGPPDSNVAGHQILRFAPDGQLDFFWNGWDHFTLDDWIEEPSQQRVSSQIDFDHPNSLEIDPADGHYVASWRNLAQITKVDSRTGRVIWRLGGARNEFRMVGDTLGGFNGQHSARVLDNGNLLVFDNGNRHKPMPVSRAVEYHLDTTDMVATQVWQYVHDSALFTPFTGSAQRLANGNTLIGFALAGLAVEADGDGVQTWQAALTVDGRSATLYRWTKIGSLYGYEAP